MDVFNVNMNVKLNV